MHISPQEVSRARIFLIVLDLLRKHAKFFLLIALAGLALRLFFVFRFPAVVDDSHLYANISLNWLHHGIYGITDSGQIMPTLSRLPGYPAFLASIFAIFGDNNFRAVLLIQILFDLGTCLLIADIAHRMFSDRAAKAAFLLAAICPFLANYAAAALTETLEIFFTTLALELAVFGLQQIDAGAATAKREPGKEFHVHSILNRGFKTSTWLGCGLSVGACILLRPDGGILYGAAAVYLFGLFALYRRALSSGLGVPANFRLFLRAAILLTLAAFTPLIPWTIRNLHTMHRFQPLAPRYAYDVDETIMSGFNRWCRTWIAEYTSTQEIYWKVPGDALDISKLPSRAFDSPEQRRETEQIFADYNVNHEITPEIDARFGELAAVRIRHSPLRYYVWLPVLRIADMWLRPRVELLPSDPRWWEFDDDPLWLTVSILFGLMNLAYVGLAIAGTLRSRAVLGMGLLWLFVALRSLFLGTLENPEPRYTLECYPVILLCAAALFRGKAVTWRKNESC
jgi:4-amino-4-deoxy-L-arabinose transferase-like glycosyltransferase